MQAQLLYSSGHFPIIGCHMDYIKGNNKHLTLNLNRIRTDFWTQNSRLFPDFFSKNNAFFFQTQGYQIVDK